MKIASIRTLLERGSPLLGVNIMYPSVGALERIGADWDWVWVDGQHGQLSYDSQLALVRACDLVDRPALVRVASHEPGAIALALDMGACGVIVPVVETREEAIALVRAAKFPPTGNRSYGGRRPIDRQGRLYSDTANADTVLIAQIESPEAVANADEIAAVEGIDGLFLGPDDIMLRRGFPMSAPRSRETIGKDMTAVVEACRAHGKFAVISAGSDPAMAALCAGMGFQLIAAGGDMRFLAEGSKQAADAARTAIAQTATTRPC